MKLLKIILLVFTFALTSCTSITLTPANFAWPIESVVTTDEMGNVSIERYSTEFNSSEIFKNEFGDSVEVANRELRVIRDHLGYYLMTAKGFMNVYVFESKDGAFNQINKIFIAKEGLQNPALNQRTPNVELLDGEKKYILNSKGTVR
ncbi:MAG: hypothetical protein U5K00_07935 [Melioribacteraceae bacterium]|nr:hypothetical protein [Melioribacteraceae bacterium]